MTGVQTCALPICELSRIGPQSFLPQILGLCSCVPDFPNKLLGVLVFGVSVQSLGFGGSGLALFYLGTKRNWGVGTKQMVINPFPSGYSKIL